MATCRAITEELAALGEMERRERELELHIYYYPDEEEPPNFAAKEWQIEEIMSIERIEQQELRTQRFIENYEIREMKIGFPIEDVELQINEEKEIPGEKEETKLEDNCKKDWNLQQKDAEEVQDLMVLPPHQEDATEPRRVRRGLKSRFLKAMKKFFCCCRCRPKVEE